MDMDKLHINQKVFTECGSSGSRGFADAEDEAVIVDVGGESTVPGAGDVGDEEEERRVFPVIH
jgi:dihydropteroate synthase